MRLRSFLGWDFGDSRFRDTKFSKISTMKLSCMVRGFSQRAARDSKI